MIVYTTSYIHSMDSLVVTGDAVVARFKVDTGLGSSVTKIEGYNNRLTVIVKNLL